MSFLINHFIRFGGFTVDTGQKVLLREGRPVPLTPKVFDTLLVLVENGGRIVGKEELMNRLWPDSFVEEANLAFNVQQLRRALGDSARNPIYIETVARRGYRFIADLEDALIDSNTAGDQITSRFTTSSAQLSEAVPGEDKEVAPQEQRPAIGLEKSEPVATLADAAWTRRSKRSVVVAATMIAVLACGGFVFWGFLHRSNKGLIKDSQIDAKSGAPLPVRLKRLTETGQSYRVAISRDGRYLAYTGGPRRNQSIWLRQLSTSTNVEIVHGTGTIYGLAFANGGEYLYFVRGHPTALYRVALLGGVPAKIVENLEGNFSLSSDDSQVAFIRQSTDGDGQRESSLIIGSSDGQRERTLLAVSRPNRLDVPLWSPDDQSIICANGNWDNSAQNVGILEVMVSAGTRRELCSHRFLRILKMAWLPHKSGLIMSAAKGEVVQLWQLSFPALELSQISDGLTSFRDLSVTASADSAVASEATRMSDIWVGSNRDPQSLRKITQAIDDFCWTPHGQLIYSSMAGGSRDIWLMQPDGAQPRQLTVNAGSNGTPAVTPDGQYIVFISNRTGELQVWRMNLDGTDQVRLTHGGGANFPAVSADGRWVVYNDTDNWRLWRVSVDGGEPRCLTAYIGDYPSVSPDGKTIACFGRNESKGELLVVPFEGGQPLKRIDLAGRRFSGTRIQWTLDRKSLIYAAERDGATAIIRQSLESSQSVQIASFDEDDLSDFGYSVDGRLLAVTRGGWQYDAVLISGLNRY